MRLTALSIIDYVVPMTKRCTTTRYATGPDGTRFSFVVSQDAVWVYTKTANLGGWKIARYGASLNSAWIRAWMSDNLKTPADPA